MKERNSDIAICVEDSRVGCRKESVYGVVKDSANEIKLPNRFRDLGVKKAMRW